MHQLSKNHQDIIPNKESIPMFIIYQKSFSRVSHGRTMRWERLRSLSEAHTKDELACRNIRDGHLIEAYCYVAS